MWVARPFETISLTPWRAVCAVCRSLSALASRPSRGALPRSRGTPAFATVAPGGTHRAGASASFRACAKLCDFTPLAGVILMFGQRGKLGACRGSRAGCSQYALPAVVAVLEAVDPERFFDAAQWNLFGVSPSGSYEPMTLRARASQRHTGLTRRTRCACAPQRNSRILRLANIFFATSPVTRLRGL